MDVSSQELAELRSEIKPHMEGDLRSNFFKFLDDLGDDTDKLVVIKKFVGFMVWYKGLVDKGLADEEIMIAGLYPATKQIKEFSFEKIIEVINAYEREIYGVLPPSETEYAPEDVVDEEGGE